ncbi:uncharacterized protein TNCT_362891 [Trichonephila clavata]|uniref:Uncharacterized protein n=1 Tax=Trichonephila clavata TaxID=2740835 RepID=A0A8X6FCM2_TRICU|nr:uncharacterized protein TNCT_362891 [Trichonephila clavata]
MFNLKKKLKRFTGVIVINVQSWVLRVELLRELMLFLLNLKSKLIRFLKASKGKMQWLSALLLGVVVGIVSCDMACYDTESNICLKEFSKEVTSSMDDYCRDQIPLIKCISEAASKCKTKFVREAEELYNIHTDACKEGTNLNKAVREHVDCITEATNGADCSSGEGGFELKDKTADEEKCKDLRKNELCMFRKVKSECSRNAGVTFLRMYHPMVRLLTKICEARGHLKI